MTRSFSEIVWMLIELYRANHKVTDSIDERLFASWVQETRAELIKQRLNESMRTINPHWIQNLGLVEMEPVNSTLHLDAVASTTSSKRILRSVEDIPWTIHSKGAPGTFAWIGPADGTERGFSLVTKERAMNSGNGKFNKHFIYAYLENKKLCITSKAGLHKQIKYINVQGVFENPAEAYEFKTGLEYDWELEYPISEEILRTLKNMVKQDNFPHIMVPIDDKKANSMDNVSNPPPESSGEIPIET